MINPAAAAIILLLLLCNYPLSSAFSPRQFRRLLRLRPRQSAISFMSPAICTIRSFPFHQSYNIARMSLHSVMVSSLSSQSSADRLAEDDETDASCATDSPSSSLVGAGGLPQYKIASVDLSQKWFELVESGKVVATTEIKDPDTTSSILVRYGIRTVEIGGISSSADDDDGNNGGERAEDNPRISCMEFVEEVSDQDGQSLVESSAHPKVQQINATLSRLQSSISSSSSQQSSSQSQHYAVQFKRVGNFAAQLQLVRMLRPPPSAGFITSSGGNKTTCQPPPYDTKNDCFVVGPFRLELRPLVATISTEELNGITTVWDIYHNISPADSRGHYLLLPTMSEPDTNWRGQILTRNDCMDLVILADNIEPAGSALISYNSFGAGASQNHIHCHLWPIPIPLLDGSSIHGWNCYAVSKAKAVSTFTDGAVQISLLDYPCCCIKLSSSSSFTNKLGNALGTVIDAVQNMFDASHNVGLLNRPDGVDVYVFVRARERSPRIVPGSRSGSSEMMGVFHTSSEDQLIELSSWNDEDGDGEGRMETVLRDVSYEPREDVWEAIIRSRLQ